jgi:hypothetical protein
MQPANGTYPLRDDSGLVLSKRVFVLKVALVKDTPMLDQKFP